MPSTVGIVASAVVPFSPLDLNPALWLDAADTTTITESGGNVSQWNDKSGNSRNFAQGTGALQPATGSSALNGLNLLTFSGDKLISTAAASTWTFLHNGISHIIATVVRFGDVADPNALYSLMSNSDNNTTAGFKIFWDDRASIGLNESIAVIVDRANLVTTADRAVSNLSVNGSFPSNMFGMLTFLTDADNATAADRSAIFIGSGLAIKNNSRTGAPSANNPPETLGIGGRPSSGTMTGAIAEIIIVSGANATEPNRVLLRDYLADKWGI